MTDSRHVGQAIILAGRSRFPAFNCHSNASCQQGRNFA